MADQQINIKIKALNQTKNAFSAVTRSIKAVGRAVLSMKTALAGVIGIAGIALLIRQSLQATDTLAKTARKIGTTTEALSRLRYAAELTGVATTTMDMALQRFVRRTAEAARGTGEAKGALRELNLDAAELLNMPLDQQMIQLSDAFKTLPTDADKVRVAMKLFDSEGVALVGTLKAGRDEIIAMFNEAEMLGIVMNRNAAAGVEKANDAITRLLTLFKGVRDQLVAALAPAIEALTTIIKDKLLAQLDSVNGDFGAFAALIRDKILGVIAGLVYGLANAARGLENFSNKIIDFINRADKFFGGEGDVFTKFTGELSSSLFNAGDAVQAFSDKLKILPNSLKGADDSLPPVRTLLDDIKNAFNSASDAIPSLQEGLDSVANTFQNTFTQAMTDAISGTKKTSEAFKDMAKSVVASLTKMLVQYYITQPLFDLITGGFGSGGKSLPKTTASLNPTLAPQTSISARAIGGSVQAGKPYMVGERGRELFVPNQTGSIVPNDKLQGGGTVVNQTINVTTGVQSTVRAEIQNLMPQITEAAKAAVADARMRGGSYSKAIRGY